MKIYTSYFAMIQRLKNDFVPVSIALKQPDWYVGEIYSVLAPTPSILSNWKANQDQSQYVRDYTSHILDGLNIEGVLLDLQLISERNNEKDIVLLCYETPGTFCHRHLVSKWFNDNGIAVEEYNII